MICSKSLVKTAELKLWNDCYCDGNCVMVEYRYRTGQDAHTNDRLVPRKTTPWGQGVWSTLHPDKTWTQSHTHSASVTQHYYHSMAMPNYSQVQICSCHDDVYKMYTGAGELLNVRCLAKVARIFQNKLKFLDLSSKS